MNNRPIVYIAGPVTCGSRNYNAYQAFEWQAALMRNGFSPINPIASLTYPFAWEEGYPHELWVECCLPLVRKADAVLRLPGDSKGADKEVAEADRCGIPVVLAGHGDEVADILESLWSAHTFPHPLIGLVGEPGVGKDEAALGLASLGYVRVSLADPLREALLALNPTIRAGFFTGYAPLADYVRIEGWGKAKKLPEVRRLLQRMGTEAGRGIHGEDCWVEIARKRILSQTSSVVVTDVRFPNEAAMIRDLGGRLVRIRRPGVACVNNHASELHYDEIECDDTWVNSTTADLWRANVRRWVRAWMPTNEGEHGRTEAAESPADTQGRETTPDARPTLATARRVGCGGD